MKRILSSILIVVTLYFGITRAIRALTNPSAEALQMMDSLGFSSNVRIVIGVCTITSMILILFPTTFLIGNILRAIQLLLILGFALKAQNFTYALMNTPFLLIPLLLIYLGHPLRNNRHKTSSIK